MRLRASIKTVNVKENLFFVFPSISIFYDELLKKIGNADILVALKTEKIIGKLTMHIPLTSMF